MDNKDLKAKYDAMHQEGKTSWFDDGHRERMAILSLGEPWIGKSVIEVGCGEGDLLAMMRMAGGAPVGLDYSEAAIDTARARYPDLAVFVGDYREADLAAKFDRIVLQGVLEHLNAPWEELKWMVDNLLAPGGDIVISAPCFANLRGVCWMTLQLLFNVPMSLTDLHFLDPWDFENVIRQLGWSSADFMSIEQDWASGQKMIDDYEKRLPAALNDAGMSLEGVPRLMRWMIQLIKRREVHGAGAVQVWRIQT